MATPIFLDDFPQFLRNKEREWANASYRDALTDISKAGIAEVKLRFATSTTPLGAGWLPLRFPRVRGGAKPLYDRGDLLKSIGSVVQIGSRQASWGTNWISARVHNFGATIRPKNGKYLAIPATKEALRAGSPRNFPFKLTFIKFTPRLAAWVLKPVNKDTFTVQYWLVTEVTIPPREFMGWNDKLIETTRNILFEELVKWFMR